MHGSILGTEVRRVEDPALLRGDSTFVDNLRLSDQTFAVFARSPHPHAIITRLDTRAAEAAAGVIGVFTGATFAGQVAPSFFTPNEQCRRPLLTADRVRFVGEPIAVVVAETRAQAQDALELIEVDYDPLPAVTDMEAALDATAPLQFPGLGSNIARGFRDRDESDPFAGADHIVRLRLENQRIATAPIEGHAIVAAPEQDAVTVWVSTQHPHLTRDLIVELTGLPQDKVRVIAPHVGGAFGGKAGIGAEHGVVVAAARLLGRPVGWTETRSEAMLSMHGRGQVQYAELGVTSAGKIVGLRARVIGDCGAYAGFGGSFALGPTYTMAQGPYEIPQLRYDAIAVLTNTAPVGAFRGAGRPEASALLERLLDVTAAELGLRPEELRRRNLLAPDAFPYRTRTGATYDVGDYARALDEALRIADVDTLRVEQERRRAAGDVRALGIGISTYVEITGFGGDEFGSVEIHPDGSATVKAGTSAHGQGHATSFAMIASDALGIPVDRIGYLQSDTAQVRSGGGTGGSRSLQLGGSAVLAAARAVHDRARALAAQLLEAPADDVVIVDGGFGVAGVPSARVDWAQLVVESLRQGSPLAAQLDVTLTGATFPFGAHVSVVEVDTETGLVTPLRHIAVDDCGRVLNPLLVAGQQHGGVAQGMSQALWEGFVYDVNGTPLTSTFADYTLPSAADTIMFEVSGTQTPTPLNELGAKGIGESGTIGSTPAVHNAVLDAIGHFGVRHLDMPCTPERVWTALRAAKEGTLPTLWRSPPEAFAGLEPRRPDRDESVDV